MLSNIKYVDGDCCETCSSNKATFSKIKDKGQYLTEGGFILNV